MQGPRKFSVSSKDIIFNIELTRNVMVIRGNGATYKTLLCKMLHAAGITGSGVHLSSYQTNVIPLTDIQFYADNLRQFKGTDTIFIIDESETCIRTDEFRKAIEDTGCYFILITRNKCSNFGVSTKELYELIADDSLDLSKRVVYNRRLYPQETFGSLDGQQKYITEDSGAGKQLFNKAFDSSKVVSAHDMSGITEALKVNQESIVIVDGAAFGFFLEDALALLTATKSYLIAKESFEYCILKSGVVDQMLPENINIDSPLVDSSKYLTWERFYTDLLETVTKDMPLAYNKLVLNRAYLTDTNMQRILSVYGLSLAASKTNQF